MTEAPPKGRTLVQDVLEKLRDQIAMKQYTPGDRLPSEARLTEEFGVSRTVVREAIAALRSDGLVDPQRGAGVFVVEPKPRPVSGFRVIDPARLSSVIELLELRAAVEVEAAGLAAQRRSPVQEEAILSALHAFNAAVETGGLDHQIDFELHLSIAEATNNPRFAEILHMFGASMIPRHGLKTTRKDAPPEYLQMLRKEHEAIVHAILDRDEDKARAAMRAHLKGSQARYRMLQRG
ncbi:FadR family transcriptional regulator [Thioclava sp. BHET1]|uniref:GntR family transcriptional regulator n=1 Tax=Thioclava dalianensis TaxID=1185766 RepID=A0A074TFR0_9RHOB|nr:FadR/GntR family transcriptional regulator [Thioclava dalianensis]KEP68990.1 GntR family transcriptional regulator [Thioclava dalianensis]TMV91826.1 FadR family transcriptional regulator [Thioclava sp. BHET1]SFN72989.1 DNA-binding transcriptional regulator, FadR family [Thioclava dalianensis]